MAEANHAAAEEYELESPRPGPTDLGNAEAGPSSPPRHTTATPKPRTRRLTLHANASAHNILFDAPNGHLPRARKSKHQRSGSNMSLGADGAAGHGGGSGGGRSRPQNFLRDDGADHDGEELDVPNFTHIFGLDDAREDHFAIAQGMRTRWKRKLYLLLEEPSSSREAFTVHVLVTGAILFSALLTTLSTLPSFHTDPASSKALFGLDSFVVVLFTIEYFARTAAHSDSWTMYYRWATSFFPILDLVAILPYYIEVARNDDTSILFRFSILRVFRLLRVFKSFTYSNSNQLILMIEATYLAFQRSRDALAALMFFILLVLVFFSTLIYFAERGTWDPNLGNFVDADGGPSLFDSIPRTAWFALVTMSTVGYGDVVPTTSIGRLLTVPLLLFGLLIIALPSFVLGRNFAIVFDALSAAPIKAGSTLNSPRASEDHEPPASRLPPTERPSSPLLPTTAEPVNAAGQRRAPSPLSALPMSQTNTSVRPAAPRMWEGGDSTPDPRSKGDLTNTKLAKNQLVLLEQIEGMRRVIDRQGQMLELLATRLGVDQPALPVVEKRAVHRAEDEDQFALGSDDDDKGDAG